jgi:5,10-methylenetetrahydromethanopterin reductase
MLMRGESIPITDHAGKTGPETRIVWARENIKTMMSATGPKNLRIAGALADIVQLQVGTHPDAIRWALRYVREGAEEAERDLDEIEVGVFTGMYVSDDVEEAWEFCRFSPNIAANQLEETVKFNPGLQLPEPLERLVNTPRAPYDYWGGHCESDAKHMALPGEVVDDFSIAGPAERCLEKLRELATCGVEEIAPGVLNGEIEQMRRVGREVIPISAGLEVARWYEVAERSTA